MHQKQHFYQTFFFPGKFLLLCSSGKFTLWNWNAMLLRNIWTKLIFSSLEMWGKQTKKRTQIFSAKFNGLLRFTYDDFPNNIRFFFQALTSGSEYHHDWDAILTVVTFGIRISNRVMRMMWMTNGNRRMYFFPKISFEYESTFELCCFFNAN